VIELVGLTAKSPPFQVTPLTLRLGSGSHALVGAPDDGVGVLLAVLAGRIATRRGRGTVLGHPLGSAAARRAVAMVARTTTLPDALRVGEALDVAAAVRGLSARAPRERLEPMGLAHLERRPCRTLAPEEARSVALAEAITSGAPVIAIDEPLVDLEPRAAPLLRQALTARARQPEACVIAATSSARDACEVAGDVLVFERGVLVRRSAATDAIALGVTATARVRVLASDPRALAAAMATEPAVRALEAQAEGAVVAAAGTLADVAAAVARAAARAGVEVIALVPEAAALEEVRAASAGDVAGAYRAAYDRAHAAAMRAAQPPGPTSPAGGA
jgi:ABC-type multidrug transport system ATPase subunit